MSSNKISSFFVLLVLVAGVVGVSTTMMSSAYADHSEVTIVPVPGSGSSPDCKETPEGCNIPMVATVDIGGVVIMSNTDTVAHTFTSGSTTNGTDGVFDSSFLLPDSSFEWRPDTAGEYPYFCLVHPWMAGTIIVIGDESTDDTSGDDENMMSGDDDSMKHDDMMSGDDDSMKHDDMKDYDDPASTGMLSDKTMIKIWASEPMMGQPMDITIKFKESEHVNYDLLVTQNGETVLNDEGAHSHEGKKMHKTAPLESSDPVDVSITFQGYGIDEITGPINEEVVFTNIVPEFGTVVMIILTVAIISMIAVTAKSSVIPRL